QLFFPSSSPFGGILASFAAFWLGFVGRPLGGMICGHLGDRWGRRRILIGTLLAMGIATTAIGLLPTYAMGGIVGPLLLCLLRFLQGIAVGGEWGGAVLLAAEHAPEGTSVRYTAFTQQGSAVGTALAAAVFAILTWTVGTQGLLGGWWRLPFLLSA